MDRDGSCCVSNACRRDSASSSFCFLPSYFKGRNLESNSSVSIHPTTCLDTFRFVFRGNIDAEVLRRLFVDSAWRFPNFYSESRKNTAIKKSFLVDGLRQSNLCSPNSNVEIFIC